MDRPNARIAPPPGPQDPHERELALARWLSHQVAPPWSPHEPAVPLEQGLAVPVTLPPGEPAPRGFFGATAPRATAAARWVGPLFATEIGPMAWADANTLVCGGQDGQIVVMHIDVAPRGSWVRLLGRQGGAITQIALATHMHYGRIVVVADSTGTVCLWALDDLSVRGAVAELRGDFAGRPPQAVWDLAIDEARGLIAAACNDGSVRLMSLNALGYGSPRSASEGREPAMRRIAIDHDTGLMAGANDAGEIAWWSLADGSDPVKLVRMHLAGERAALLLAPIGGGAWLSVHADAVRVWRDDSDSATPVWEERAERSAIVSAAFHRPTLRVAWAGADGRLHACDLAPERGAHRGSTNAHAGAVEALAFSDDGHRLASLGTDDVARLWDAQDIEEPLASIDTGGPSTHRLAFGPDGRWLAGAGEGEILRTWHIASDGTPSQPSTWRAPAKPLRLIARGDESPIARPLATAGEDGSVWVWPATDDNALPIRYEHSAGAGLLGCLESTPDGRHVLAGRADGRIWAMELEASERPTRMAGRRGSAVRCMALALEGGLAASGDADGMATTWQVGGPTVLDERLRWKASDAALVRMAWVPRTRRLVTADASGLLRAWNLATDVPPEAPLDIWQAHEGNPSCLAIGGLKVVSGGADGRLHRRELTQQASAQSTGESWPAHEGGVLAVAIDLLGPIFSVGQDGHLRMWAADQIAARAAMADWPAHDAPARHLALIAGGIFIATASDDGTVKIWDPKNLARRTPVATWHLDRPVRRVLWQAGQVAARFDGGWCRWRTAKDDASEWTHVATVLQLDATTLLRLTEEGIELILDRPLHTTRDAAGRLLPADREAWGCLGFADVALDPDAAPAEGEPPAAPRMQRLDAWQLADRLEWPADESPARRMRVRWADGAEALRWLPRLEHSVA